MKVIVHDTSIYDTTIHDTTIQALCTKRGVGIDNMAEPFQLNKPHHRWEDEW